MVSFNEGPCAMFHPSCLRDHGRYVSTVAYLARQHSLQLYGWTSVPNIVSRRYDVIHRRTWFPIGCDSWNDEENQGPENDVPDENDESPEDSLNICAAKKPRRGGPWISHFDGVAYSLRRAGCSGTVDMPPSKCRHSPPDGNHAAGMCEYCTVLHICGCTKCLGASWRNSIPR